MRHCYLTVLFAIFLFASDFVRADIVCLEQTTTITEVCENANGELFANVGDQITVSVKWDTDTNSLVELPSFEFGGETFNPLFQFSSSVAQAIAINDGVNTDPGDAVVQLIGGLPPALIASVSLDWDFANGLPSQADVDNNNAGLLDFTFSGSFSNGTTIANIGKITNHLPVPEPASTVILTGLTSMLFFRRRSRRVPLALPVQTGN